MQYLDVARNRASPFVSVIPSCSQEENAKRATSGDRGNQNTKLTDLAILKYIRDTEDIFHFDKTAQLELDIDVSTKSASEAAILKTFILLCRVRTVTNRLMPAAGY